MLKLDSEDEEDDEYTPGGKSESGPLKVVVNGEGDVPPGGAGDGTNHLPDQVSHHFPTLV